MAERTGDIALSTNAALRKAWTFDDRGMVTSYAALLSAFTADDQLPNGFYVAVNNPDPTQVSIYQLLNKNDLSNPDSWKKVGGGTISDVEGLQQFIDQTNYELQELRQLIGDIETPPAPEGVVWVQKSTIEIVGDKVILGGQASIIDWGNENVVTYNAGTEVGTLVTPPDGYGRIDFVVFDEASALLKSNGNEVTPTTPPVGINEMYLGFVFSNSSGAAINPVEHTHENATAEKAGFMSPAQVAALAGKAENAQTANLWSWIGLAASDSLITVKGWLDFLTNKIKLAEEAIATKLNASVVETTLSPASNEKVPTSKAMHDHLVSTIATGVYGTSSLVQVGDYLAPCYISAWGSFFTQVHSTGAGMALLFYPVDKPITVNAIQVQVNTADAANSTRFGIYRCGLDGKPKDMITDIGTGTWSSTGIITITFPALEISPPGFFIAHQSNASNASMRSIAGQQSISILGVSGISTNQTNVIGFLYANSYGSMPATLDGVTASGKIAGSTVTMGIAVRKSA